MVELALAIIDYSSKHFLNFRVLTKYNPRQKKRDYGKPWQRVIPSNILKEVTDSSLILYIHN